MRKLGVEFLLRSAFTVTVLVGTAEGGLVTVGPADPWCLTINSASPGDEVVLLAGSYTTPCWITARGIPSAWITIRSNSELPSDRATFAYPGSTSNVIELRDTAYIVVRGFAFAPTQVGVDAIRIMSANDVVIERNAFQAIGGISIAANHSSIQRLTVRNNSFRDLKATGLYFGCHDGLACAATELLVEGNLIDGVSVPDPSVGYGLEIKLNSHGTVKDNTVYRTKGPGIMVYGSNRGDPASIIEGNYVEGSRNEGGIVVGGGPAVVRNNVLVANAYGGVSAQNYGGRGLQTNVWIVHNTILRNEDSGINVQGWSAGANNVIAYNAIVPQTGTLAIRPSTASGLLVGNVTCASNPDCFVNSGVAPYDLWPPGASPLLDAAGTGGEAWRPTDDFMGVLRGAAADVGAFERHSAVNEHLVGGGNPRPPRLTPPAAPGGLRAQ